MHRSILLIAALALSQWTSMANSHERAQQEKQATLDLYWHTSVPFIYEGTDQSLVGIEFELMQSFSDYMQDFEGVNLTLNWIRSESFYDIIEEIKDRPQSDAFGVSAFSITKERKEIVKFTDPYLPDITVLVSSAGTPIVDTYEEINEMMNEMTAVSIKGTSYEKLLDDLKRDLLIDFDVEYIGSNFNILENIAGSVENKFAFIDLPVYLMFIKNGGDLTRQNLFTNRGTGYGLIMPFDSDWNEPFNRFLANEEYRDKIAVIISKYLGAELYEYIDNIYKEDELGTSLLTKEKEIQLELIRNANLKLAEEREVKRILLVGITIAIAFLVTIGIMFGRNQKKTRLLFRQKRRIEFQQGDIELKNEQLVNRNARLIALNEEKNNLVKILAHDIRSPLNQIIGLANVLPKKLELQDKDMELVDRIAAGAQRINQMVAKILDVESLEDNRSTVQKERVDIRSIMRDIKNRYQPIASAKGITMEVQPCKRKYMIETDHLLLFLVLENLVSNAIKFSPSGKLVTLEANCMEKEMVFKIGDEGPGFTDEDKANLYKPFQKLSAKPTGDEASTGLGLSIVKKYTKELGGEIELVSEPGKGSQFFVHLPA